MNIVKMLLIVAAFGAAGLAGAADGPFMKVSDTEQKSRDDRRVEILKSELAEEKSKLAKAQIEQVELANRRASDEEIQPSQNKITRHTQNIEAIQKEIELVSKKPGGGKVKPVSSQTSPGAAPSASEVPYWDTFRRKQ